MVREIHCKARGKKIDNNEWVYGFPLIVDNRCFIVQDVDVCFQVINETLGMKYQFNDKQGNEIYEGDVVVEYKEDWESLYDSKDEYADDDPIWSEPLPLKKTMVDVVTLSIYGYWLKDESFGYEGEGLVSSDMCEVIGNVFDNPTLLEDERNTL